MVDFPLPAMLVFGGVSKNSPKVSGTKIGGTVPNQAVLRMVFSYISRIHTAYIGTWNV